MHENVPSSTATTTNPETVSRCHDFSICGFLCRPTNGLTSREFEVSRATRSLCVTGYLNLNSSLSSVLGVRREPDRAKATSPRSAGSLPDLQLQLPIVQGHSNFFLVEATPSQPTTTGTNKPSLAPKPRAMKWVAVFAIFAATASAQCQINLYGPCGDSSRPRDQNCCTVGYCQPWNSGYYQCIDKPSKCPTQETDIDYYGNDVQTLYGLQPSQCCDACTATPACKAYTFVNQNPDGKTACYLKTSMAGRVEKKGAVSGTFVVVDPPQPPAKCPLQEIGYDYYGNDIKSIMGISQGDCCEECSKTVFCTAYTWVERGFDGRSACYLKSADSGRTPKAGAISGVLKEVPPPADCPAPEYNMDYYGNDLKALFGVTQGQCCDECGKTPSCVAYTYIPQDESGRSACYLKWSMDGRRGRPGAIGNRRKDPPTVPGNCPKQEADTDFYGNDIKKIQGISNTQCCDECGKTSLCAAYTYSASDLTCYLKTSSAGRTNKPGAVSGEYKCPTQLMGQCGSSSTGALCCPDGAYCQPWNPAYYHCVPKPENAKCPTVVTGVDFYGGDLEVQFGLLPSACCEACFKNKDCHVYTFINFNTNGQSLCYLKSKVVEQRPRADAVSGYKIK